jgi:FkbM family methyltransferase
MLASQTVQLSRPYTFVGRPGDDYFDRLPDHAAAIVSYRQFLQAVGPGHVLDVGANIGVTVMIAHDLGAKSITAFEASPEVFGYLLQNVRTNGVVAQVHNWAVGAKKGFVQFYEKPFLAGSCVITDQAAWQPDTVRVRAGPLDRFMREFPHKIDAFKMDIEGFELAAFDGANRFIAKHRPTAFVEMNSWCLIGLANRNPRELVDRMLQLFPYVLVAKRGGGFAPLSTPIEVSDFIRDHIVYNQGIDDLIGTFDTGVRDRLLAA